VAERRSTAQRKKALIDDVRGAINSRAWPVGSALPTLRELGARYELSAPTVLNELEQLMVEGLLHARPRRGIFVSSPGPAGPDDGCLFVARDAVRGDFEWLHTESIRHGFERAVSRLGGYTVFARESQLRSLTFRARLPRISGVFYFIAKPVTEHLPGLADVPIVRYGYTDDDAVDAIVDAQNYDHIHFDDRDAGRQATHHLIQHGHSRIAFMAAHSTPLVRPQSWSRQREEGWREAMSEAFAGAELLSFHRTPKDVAESLDNKPGARAVARQMLRQRSRFDAVVGADDVYVLALAQVWQAAGVPAAEWPAMVGSEGLREAENYVLTSVVPPYEQLGEEAGELLRGRITGRIQGPPVERAVRTHLISRLSSRKDWNDQGAAGLLLDGA
jgi:DNA-binding LacI/PurR family transcriptional regulator